MFLTILTTTYNRGQYLKRCYESLKKQKNYDFQWLIIDDGSVDNTKDIIKDFQQENNLFTIDYYFKNNGGKHTALNYSHTYIKGDFIIILDSDDYFTDDAIENILKYWNKYKNDHKIWCITFDEGISENEPFIKTCIKYEYRSNFIDYRINNRIKGDQVECYRTKIFTSYKYPEIDKEKFFSEDYVVTKVAYEFDTIYVKKVIYLAEYLNDGLTKKGRKLHIDNPIGSMLRSELYTDTRFAFFIRLKGMILQICYAKFANISLLKLYRETKYKSLYFVSFPVAITLFYYWKQIHLKDIE